jgi:hypothetical protein
MRSAADVPNYCVLDGTVVHLARYRRSFVAAKVSI